MLRGDIQTTVRVKHLPALRTRPLNAPLVPVTVPVFLPVAIPCLAVKLIARSLWLRYAGQFQVVQSKVVSAKSLPQPRNNWLEPTPVTLHCFLFLHLRRGSSMPLEVLNCKIVPNKKHHRALIVVALITLLVSCSNSSVRVTGPETLCRKDSDCWCRRFTGEKFIEGTEQSRCCTKIEPLFCPEVNRCLQCFYD